MKNNQIIILTIFLYFFNIDLLGQDFNIQSTEIEIMEKGNLIVAKNGVKIETNDSLKIEGENSEYDKKLNILKIFGNVKVYDKINNILIKSEKINYLKNKELIFTEGESTVELENKYLINSSNLNFNRKLMTFFSDKKTVIIDNRGHYFKLDKFNFDITNKILEGKNAFLKDLNNNNYFLKSINVNLKNYDFSGNELNIDFNNSLFGNNENEPRISGERITDNINESTIYNGTFTTCKKNKKNCPPWLISAKEIKHKKQKKIIEYRNAWLKIYDKPVIYFPYFYHPDPTVKRQSGFLAPTIINSSVSGTTLKIPYYKVISKDKDITISPQIFLDKKVIFQSEYRQAFKNSDAIIDFSFTKEEGKSKSHFFSNIKGKKNESFFELNLEKVNNDKYLKIDKIDSPLITSKSELNSYLNYEASSENYNLSTSLEVFEDLNKAKSDRFEYIYPDIKFSKNLNYLDNYGQLEFSTEGYQKNFNTNQYEASMINDFIFKSDKYISKKGFINNYKFLLRNVNSDLKNNVGFTNGNKNQMFSTLLFESKYPLKNSNGEQKSLLTPILSARYSPSKTKNIKNLDRRISYNNIYSLDRVGDKNTVEGGFSLTVGSEYSLQNDNEREIVNFAIASVLRNNGNDDLPDKTTIGSKRSDIIGKLNYKPSKLFNLEYEFSVNKDLRYSNYDLLKTNFTVNNFVTSFEFLEEDNLMGDKSYITNNSKLALNKNSNILFETSKNLDKNLTDYYNLIYEYNNDCLTAALKFNKTFYKAEDLNTDKNIFFILKIIPFGELSSPDLK